MKAVCDGSLPGGMPRLLGLDVGDRRIGLALSDPLNITAQPLGVLERVGLKKDLDALAAMCVEHGVGELVVGLPTDRYGELGPQAENVLGFVKKLAERTDLPVRTWDERFTTVAAERTLRDGGVPGKRRKGVRDQMAAQLILQAYLDARRSTRNIGSDEE